MGSEAKGKSEAIRMKKKLETDVLDLDTALEHANAANADTQKVIKKYQLSLRDVQVRLEDAQRAKDVAHDNLIAADRKAHANQNALEEARTMLEQSDRARRMVEQELADTNETLGDQTCTNQTIQGAKMRLDSEMHTLNADLDEMATEASLSEEKAQKAMIDAARLAEELRAEQETAQGLERQRKLLEAQAKDMQCKLDEDEDKKNHERMQALIDQLQGKIKSYKKQIEEAEEIAALNLAKYRQTQTVLASSQENADTAEQSLAKMKTRARSSSLAPM